MKYRKDFVTNSSSSSYVCEICGRQESGWDISLLECGMVECVDGHTFCEDEALELDRTVMIKKLLEDEYNKHSENELIEMDDEELLDECDLRHYFPAELCPICQFIEYSQEDLSAYLLKKYKIDREVVFSEVKKANKRRKKLYENEYITYVCKEYNLSPAEIVAGWKKEFVTYEAFRRYILAK